MSSRSANASTRALDAVITSQEAGIKVGLVNKPTLNVYDEAMMKTLAARPLCWWSRVGT